MAIPASDPSLAAAPRAAGAAPGTARRWGHGTIMLGTWGPAAFLALLVAACFFLPLIAPVPSPTAGSVLNASLPPGSPGHLFGTNAVGDDVLSQVLYGGRVSLEVGAATQLIGLLVGGTIGAVAGFSTGLLGTVIMRVIDVLIAFPALVLALAIAEGMGPSEVHVIWALTFFSVPAFARVARAATLQVRDRVFVVACDLLGSSRRRIMVRHLVPNILPQLVTYGLLGAGLVIVLEGALSFLGLGVPPPNPSWGNMISSGEATLSVSPYLVLIPSAFLLATVLALNLLGESLRQRWSAR
jgi:peptide/nickel transport system permease protein